MVAHIRRDAAPTSAPLHCHCNIGGQHLEESRELQMNLSFWVTISGCKCRHILANARMLSPVDLDLLESNQRRRGWGGDGFGSGASEKRTV
eukprot:4737937-Amphidinium_carterae.1